MRPSFFLPGKGLSLLLAAALGLGASTAQARLAEMTSEDAMNEIIDLATNDLLSQTDSGDDADGPILGMPKADQVIIGRMQDVWMNPTYWETWVREFLENGNFQIPSPTDIVKPEAWTDNVPVANNPAYVSPLPTALKDTSQFVYTWNGAEKTVREFMVTTETDMINFVVDGFLVDELYINGYNSEVRHQPWSVTKTFIAATVGIAFEAGLIDSLQDPIEKYIPMLRDAPQNSVPPLVHTQPPSERWMDEGQPGARAQSEWVGVTVEDVLQMESGVHWDEDTPVLALNTQVQQWIMVMLDHYTQGQLGQTRNEFLAALPDSAKADGASGVDFSYNSGNTQVLAWMLENLYGEHEKDENGWITEVTQPKPYNEIVSDLLWKPIDMAGDAKMIADREGAVIASQGLYARPHDFARFGEVLRNGGVNADGRRILPAAWVTAMTDMTDVSNGRYGYQTWSSDAGEGAYKASGFQGQKITVVPEKCVTAVRMAHSFGLDYRDESQDPMTPDAWGFGTNFSSDEWASMVKQLSEHLRPENGGCTPVVTEPGPPRSPGQGAENANERAQERANEKSNVQN